MDKFATGRFESRRFIFRRRVVFSLAVVAAVALTVAVWRGAQAFLADDHVPPRLHVVAHSDGAADQTLKLHVRDALRPAARQMMEEGPTGHPVQLLRLQRAAEAELERRGAAYGVQVVADRTKAGELAAIRIVLGEGRGANWFCVLVPPLCFADLEPIEAVPPVPGQEPGEGGIRIGWKWLGRLFGKLRLPVDGVGNVDQDDIYADFADAAPRDGDVGFAGE